MASTVYGKVTGEVNFAAAGAAATAAAGAAAGVAATAAAHATTMGRAMPSGVAGQLEAARDFATDTAENTKQHAVAAALSTKGRAEQALADMKRLLETWAKQRLFNLVEKLVGRIPGITKTLLEDPQMPECVARGQDRLIDALWPDVREELLWEVAVLLDKDTEKDKTLELEPASVCGCVAFFRYHLFPYDRGFWGQWQDPAFIVLRLISMIPIFGISPLFFLFEFFIIDKSDEFQLIQFILGFKGTQFLSAGLIRAVTGLSLFFVCVTAHAHASEHSCERNGPGNASGFWLDILGFVIQVGIVWVAFFMLPCATSKGRSKLGRSLSDGDAEQGKKGAYIKYLLWYDLVSALLCCSVPVAVLASRSDPGSFEDDKIWYVEHVVFASQAVYGLLSVPFFFFTLPGLNRVLTHALPTAYDREGRCVQPIVPRPPPREDEVKAKLSLREAVCSDEDAKKLLNMLKAAPTSLMRDVSGVVAPLVGVRGT